MQRRSFVASLLASITAIPFNPIKAFAKPKVEPFWDWTCTLRFNDGQTVTRVMHTSPRLDPPKETAYNGRHFNLATSDLIKRRVTYRETPTIAELTEKGWRMYIEKTEGALQ